MAINRAKPDQYQLRFPPGLRDRLKGAADLRARSMNAEIIARLERSFVESFDDEERKASESRINALLDLHIQTKDMARKALNALDRNEMDEVRRRLLPIAWFEPVESDASTVPLQRQE